jgi:putative ABC transport system permease protein
MPPKYAIAFLRWFCREDYIEEIEGDLTEIFDKEFENSPGRARRRFTWSVLKYFRPVFIKSFKKSQPNSIGMYKSYTIAFHMLVRFSTSSQSLQVRLTP